MTFTSTIFAQDLCQLLLSVADLEVHCREACCRGRHLRFGNDEALQLQPCPMFGDDSKDRSFELSGLSDQTSSVGKSVYPLVAGLSRARVVAGSFLEPALLDILILLVGGQPKLGVPADIGIA